MTPDDRLRLDGAFKAVARAQNAVGALAAEGTEKVMTAATMSDWSGYFQRLKAARLLADKAQTELEDLYMELVGAQAIG